MSARRVSGCSGVTNSPNSPEFRAIQDKLVQPWRVTADLPRIEFVDEMDLMNAPFSLREFSLLVFIPKTGTGKFHPISHTPTLCKLFERLV